MIRVGFCLIGMSLFSWLFNSCSSKDNSANSTLPDISTSIDEGFVDLTLALTSCKRCDDGSQVCVAEGIYKGQRVGFRFVLPSVWKKGSLGDTGITTHQAIIKIESIGTASDAFVASLAALYAGPLQPVKMAESVAFTAISLEGTPSQLEAAPTRIKLFFEPAEDSEDAYEHLYAEHYLNVDFASKLVGFHEKDPEYRAAMLRALSGETHP